jgi:hypothetical protein
MPTRLALGPRGGRGLGRAVATTCTDGPPTREASNGEGSLYRNSDGSSRATFRLPGERTVWRVRGRTRDGRRRTTGGRRGWRSCRSRCRAASGGTPPSPSSPPGGWNGGPSSGAVVVVREVHRTGWQGHRDARTAASAFAAGGARGPLAVRPAGIGPSGRNGGGCAGDVASGRSAVARASARGAIVQAAPAAATTCLRPFLRARRSLSGPSTAGPAPSHRLEPHGEANGPVVLGSSPR